MVDREAPVRRTSLIWRLGMRVYLEVTDFSDDFQLTLSSGRFIGVLLYLKD